MDSAVSTRLNGRVAVVTGGGAGIGAAIAERFAREGACVAIGGRRAALLEETRGRIVDAGGSCLTVAGDCATEEGAAAIFAQAKERFGPVDLLVNNAGIAGPTAPIWEQQFAGWEETLRINLSGPWLCAREAARQMMPLARGRIINIGSMSGKRPLANRTPYTSAKMGLVGLTKTLAVELGAFNINVNCISPGAVNTGRLAEIARAANVPLERVLEGAAAGAALKRISEPADIAALAAFLASDEASNITGIDITVDAGVWFS
ncbi:MAG: SDR family oxidoreductase [Chloroflexi bacterium]|nr:SDR family oxidoreductase [Chloroflexota bacterium]